jgi:hypothetical protein
MKQHAGNSSPSRFLSLLGCFFYFLFNFLKVGTDLTPELNTTQIRTADVHLSVILPLTQKLGHRKTATHPVTVQNILCSWWMVTNRDMVNMNTWFNTCKQDNFNYYSGFYHITTTSIIRFHNKSSSDLHSYIQYVQYYAHK